MHKFIGIGLVLLLPTTLHAEPLTFDTALQRAQSETPSLKGREAGVTAVRSAASAADRLSDRRRLRSVAVAVRLAAPRVDCRSR